MSIYVRDAGGNRQKIAGVGLPGPAGKSAYQYAVEGGFSGTEEEFRAVVGIRNNDNLLDNWYFVDPINQRGQISYSGPGYMIDRWFLWDSSSSCTLSEDGVSGSGWMCERLENVSIPRGMQCTLSILSANGVNALQFYDETNSVNIVNKPVNSSFGGATFSVPTTCNAARIGVNFKSGSAVKAVKLELGPVQTLAHKDASGNWVLNDPPPNKALELAKCQRYFLPVGTDTPFAGRSSVLDSSEGIFFIPTPVTMRANPSFDADLDHIIIYLPDGRKTHPKSITTSVYPNGIRVNFLTNESLGTSIALVVAISHPYKYYLDANL